MGITLHKGLAGFAVGKNLRSSYQGPRVRKNASFSVENKILS